MQAETEWFDPNLGTSTDSPMLRAMRDFRGTMGWRLTILTSCHADLVDVARIYCGFEAESDEPTEHLRYRVLERWPADQGDEDAIQ